MSDNDPSGPETGNPHVQVLSWVVDRYDRRDQPVTVADAATHFEQEIETVQSCFEHLESNYLLTTEGDGYRPTVTARELLELDVEDGSPLILDITSDTAE